MKRKSGLICLAIIGVSLVGIAFDPSPAPVSAGGWPCFLCHGGFEVAGTDLAPQLAGSRLTDEQIIAQVRNPRGMMPAFSREELSDQVLKDGFINPFVRALPAGRPTATLSAENRAMALATLAAVAATRAKEYAPTANAPIFATPTPFAQVSPVVAPPRAQISPGMPPPTAIPLARPPTPTPGELLVGGSVIVATTGTLLVMIVGAGLGTRK